MKQFFIHDGQNEKGPLDIEQLKLESIKFDTPIWYEGLENWTTAGEVEELKSLFIPKSTPPPLNKSIAIPSIQNLPPEFVKPTNKKSLKIPLILAGGITVIGIIGWLVYQNKSQADTLDVVKQQVSQQDQQITQQQQEQDRQQHEQQEKQQQEVQLQQAKDSINGVITEKYMGYRNNWRSYILATHGAYNYSELGGISNLSVIVYNQTDKSIDEVQVKIDYIKANGGVYKSETVSLSNIGPNGSKTVSAPSSDRGTSVRMEIQSISAKSFHFCYPDGMGGNRDLDPYFCK